MWVVDASDAARLAESAAALAPISPSRASAPPLLVFANKADVGGWDAGVVTDDAITAALGLGGRRVPARARSAVDGRGVADGFEWLARALGGESRRLGTVRNFDARLRLCPSRGARAPPGCA